MSVEPTRTVDITHLIPGPARPTDLLMSIAGITSRREATRLLVQGAVELHHPDWLSPLVITTDEPIVPHDGLVLHVGKRRWYRLKISPVFAEVYEFTSLEDERAFLESCPYMTQEAIERTIKDDWVE
ncbi:unnamed protein product [marine sediment metagenome]|uniref:RNA-binding S4 domain-containing protein n=1 Tax=marine sediment metagenome TaxID=412755 RepID=X0TTG1_9ZZZZ